VCQQSPCGAHHLKFAQPRAHGRKFCDEFAVPLCRGHQEELHRHGNERAWWANLQIAPLPIAQDLWAASPVHGPAEAAVKAAPLAAILGSEASWSAPAGRSTVPSLTSSRSSRRTSALPTKPRWPAT
jgi:hypothetical protein